KRLESLTSELDQRLGQLRALGDRTVERGAGEFALHLEILGGALGLGERADRVRSGLEAVALLGDDVLADAARTFGRNAAGLDDCLDVRTSEVGELFGNLLALLDELLAALIGLGEDRLKRGERRDGVDVESILGHDLGPLLGHAGRFRGSLARGDTGLANSTAGCGLGGRLLCHRFALHAAGGGSAGAL